jgi:tetratricopeptide (TPR) repeat protein
LKYLKLLSRKLFLFWHETEIPNNFSLYAAEDYSPMLRRIPFTFGMLAPLGFAFWLTVRRRRELALVNLYGLAYLLATLIFFAASEYRLPLLLILLPMTAAGLQTLWQSLRARQFRSAVSLAAVSVLLAVPVNMPTKFTTELQLPYMDYFNLGSVLQKQKRFEESISPLQRCLLLKPDYTEGHKLLGDSYHVLGLRDEAAVEFQRAGLDSRTELNMLDAENMFRQAQGLAAQGRSQEALNLYQQGLAIHPEPPSYVYFNMAYLALTSADTVQCEHYLQQAAEVDPQEPRVPFLSGLIAESRHQWPEAAQKFNMALNLQPGFSLARAHAALAVLRSGDKTEAGRLIEPLLGKSYDDQALEVVVKQVAGEVGY